MILRAADFLFRAYAPRGNANDHRGRFDGNGFAPFTGPNHVDLMQQVDHGPDGGAGASEGDVDPFVAEGGEVGDEVAISGAPRSPSTARVLDRVRPDR